MDAPDPTSTPPSPRLLLLLLLIVGLVHAPGLGTGYAYDDVEAILENEDLRHWSRAGNLLFTNYWGERNIGLYRPMVQLSYLVDGAGFDFDPFVSHLFNLLLHLGVVAFAFLLLHRLGFRAAAAFTASLLYGVSPAILQGAVWISGRTDVLAALFVFAGLWIGQGLAADEREGWLADAWDRRCLLLGACWLLGLLSKEMAVTLPILLLLAPGSRYLRRTLPVLGIALAVYLALRLSAVDGFLPSHAGEGEGVVLRDQGLFDRVAIGYRACFRLLVQVVVPLGLCADHRVHPWALPDAPDDATAYGALFVAGVLFVAGRQVRRRDPVLGFLLSALPVVYLPLSQAIPIGAVMAERFNYLPALFLIALLTRFASLGLRRQPRLVPVVAWLVVGLVAASTVITLRRIPVYEDRGSFCRDVLAVYPEDHKAWNNLGVYLFLERDPPDFTEADRALTRALEIEPGYRRGRLNLVRCRMERAREEGRAPDVAALDGILGRWLERGHHDALFEAGRARLRAAEKDSTAKKELLTAAGDLFERSASLREQLPRGEALAASAWKQAGLAARRRDDAPTAIRCWKRALELDPEIASAEAMRHFIAAEKR